MPLTLSFVLFASLHQAHAQTNRWTGFVSNDWATASNWDNGLPDGSPSRTAIRDNGNVLLSTTYDENVPDLFIGQQTYGSLTIRGASANLTNLSRVYLGGNGGGLLRVDQGGKFRAGGMTAAALESGVRNDGNVSGNAIVDGVGSEIKTWLNFDIGIDGPGTLGITNGGQTIVGRDSLLGVKIGHPGTVTVDGAASRFRVNRDLYGGYAHTGSITATNSATVSLGQNLILGLLATGSGSISLAGGSTLEVGGVDGIRKGAGSASFSMADSGIRIVGSDLTTTVPIGISGTTTIDTNGLNASFGGVFTGGGSILKTGAGTLTLPIAHSHTGGTVFQGGTVRITHAGALGTGPFTFAGGALLVDGVAFASTPFVVTNGAAIVDGAASSITSSNYIEVGNNAAGTLELKNGGKASSAFSFVAGITGSGAGGVTINGASSLLEIGTFLVLGHTPGTTGSLAITDAGAATVQGNAVVGLEGTGSLSVGSGSTFHTGLDLNVGAAGNGNGALTITGGGIVTTGANALSGYDGTGNATVSGAGSLWDITGYMEVAHGAGGTLLVESGGEIRTGASFAVGVGAAADGEATVTGAGSKLQIGTTFYGAFNGKGSLAIADGASMTSQDGLIGFAAGSEGSVSISGSGSTWHSTGNVLVGRGGVGMLTITGGGIVTTGVNAFAGYDGTGNTTVSGAGSLWDISGYMEVAHGAGGTLLVENGGEIRTAASFAIGAGAAADGQATVTGVGSKLQIGTTFYSAFNGTGSLAIAGGAGMSSQDGLIGFSGGSEGSVSISGSGSTWHSTGNILVGREGGGALTVANGGLVSVTGHLALGGLTGGAGAVNLNTGGTIEVGGPGGIQRGSGGATFNLAGGTIRTTGSPLTSNVDIILSQQSIIDTPALAATLSGILSGTGTLTKVGGGVLTLANSNSYTGAIQINQGTLVIIGATQATSAIAVGANGVLGLDIASPVAASNATVDLSAGGVLVAGTPTLPSYTLLSAQSITGTPVLAAPVPDYELEIFGGNELRLVKSGSPYETWSAIHAPTGGPADDFDDDGVSNAIEFVLGGTKETNDLAKLPTANREAGDLVFRFIRDSQSIDDTTVLTIETSTTLDAWPVSDSYHVGADTAGSTPGVTVSKETPIGGLDTITLAVPVVPDGRKFFRLKVEIAP